MLHAHVTRIILGILALRHKQSLDGMWMLEKDGVERRIVGTIWIPKGNMITGSHHGAKDEAPDVCFYSSFENESVEELAKV